MQYGLKQHLLVVHDAQNEDKNIFKMEFNVLNGRLFKKLPPERIKEVGVHIDSFIASLKRFKKEISKK